MSPTFSPCAMNEGSEWTTHVLPVVCAAAGAAPSAELAPSSKSAEPAKTARRALRFLFMNSLQGDFGYTQLPESESSSSPFLGWLEEDPPGLTGRHPPSGYVGGVNNTAKAARQHEITWTLEKLANCGFYCTGLGRF